MYLTTSQSRQAKDQVSLHIVLPGILRAFLGAKGCAQLTLSQSGARGHQASLGRMHGQLLDVCKDVLRHQLDREINSGLEGPGVSDSEPELYAFQL
jgi:hypothetical protein